MKLGDQIIRFIDQHETDDIYQLALKANQYPDIDMAEALKQIKGKQIAKLKIPSWYSNKSILYPKHLSMEQCSSEYTAIYKSDLCSGESFTDLTGGFGVDFAFLSKKFVKSTYVEKQLELSKIAKYNFSVLNLDNVEVINDDGISHLNNTVRVDWIYIDPARRSDLGRKTVLIEDCTPDIIALQEQFRHKCCKLMIKLSPMLDISSAIMALNNISSIHVISHNNECKELVFIVDYNKDIADNDIMIYCANIMVDGTSVFAFTRKQESEIVLSNDVQQVKKYLYEPNASIIKAGAYKSIIHYYGNIYKLHRNSHLYTSDNLIGDFQGRIFEILSTSSLNKKEIKRHLKGIRYANISTRNFPLNSQDLKKRLNLNDGGDIYIFGTTLSDNKKVLLICKKL